jgi:hypothetical protein
MRYPKRVAGASTVATNRVIAVVLETAETVLGRWRER